jgi:hypothetical protein
MATGEPPDASVAVVYVYVFRIHGLVVGSGVNVPGIVTPEPE